MSNRLKYVTFAALVFSLSCSVLAVNPLIVICLVPSESKRIMGRCITASLLCAKTLG